VTDFRQARSDLHASWTSLAWPYKVAAAGGMAGFLALMSQLSVPLPFTPVPFSFQVVGVAVAGAYLGRNYGVLAVALYVLAGALGLKVFANQTSTGIEILTGATAGYIVGFAIAAYFVGWYVEQRRANLLDNRTAGFLAAAFGAMALVGLVVVLWVSLNPAAFETAWQDSYGTGVTAGQYLVWVMLGLLALGAAVSWILVRRAHGTGREKLNLYLVVLGGFAIIHAAGVLVLKPSLDYSWPQALALGSLVFLPFDMVKAGLAVALTSIFLPTRSEQASSRQSPSTRPSKSSLPPVNP
jgi:biotin transport system substrate-specific component